MISACSTATAPPHGEPAGCHVCRLRSDPGPCDVDCKLGETQGAHAAHGIHYFVTDDTDNARVAGHAHRDRRAAMAVHGADQRADERRRDARQRGGVPAADGRDSDLAPLRVWRRPWPPTSPRRPIRTRPSSSRSSGLDVDTCDLAFSVVAPPGDGGRLDDHGCTHASPGTPNTDGATITYTPDRASPAPTPSRTR